MGSQGSISPSPTLASASASSYPLDTSIFIIGGSVFGLSSAYHLTKAGYHNITVFDRAATLPSPYAASHDLNKIVRAEYGTGHAEDDFYTDLALQAMEAWSSPQWESCFRKTGYLRLAKAVESQEGIERDVADFSTPRKGSMAGQRWFPTGAFQVLRSIEDIRKSVTQLDGAQMEDGWSGALNRHAGYALASKAIRLLHNRCADAGVKFVLGPDGHVVHLDGLPEGRVTGLCASNGEHHLHPSGRPSLTILAMGAELPRLLSAAATQLTGKSWSVAHLELTPEEALQLQNVPVVSLGGLGFWIEPVFVPDAFDGLEDHPTEVERSSRSAKTAANSINGRHLLKLAAHGGGWTNSTSPNLESKGQPELLLPAALPPFDRPSAIPASDEHLIRELIRLTLPPHFLNKPLIRKSMCWCADTASSDFVIDFAPERADLLFAGADSGHAFKFLPTAGEWVAEVVKSGRQREPRWRWKKAGNRSDIGATVAWRGGSARDLDGQAMV